MWKTTDYKGEAVTWYAEDDIKPFLDPYFKGLDFKTIAELAKKSIRITADNTKLEHKIEDVIEACNNLKYQNEEYIKIDEVLNILK